MHQGRSASGFERIEEMLDAIEDRRGRTQISLGTQRSPERARRRGLGGRNVERGERREKLGVVLKAGCVFARAGGGPRA